MDLDLLETVTRSEDGVWFEPVDFDGNPIGVEFKVRGVDSKAFKRAISERASKTVARAIEKKAGAKAEERDVDDRAESVADVVMGWRETGNDLPPAAPGEDRVLREVVTISGKAYEYSRENAVLIFTKIPFVADQIDRFVAKRKNFTKPVSQS